jgi:hypothetical protein
VMVEAEAEEEARRIAERLKDVVTAASVTV